MHLASAVRYARTNGFEATIYHSEADNVYHDDDKEMAATWSPIVGTKAYGKYQTPCLYQGEAYCVNRNEDHACGR